MGCQQPRGHGRAHAGHGAEAARSAGIFKYDLTSGTLIKRYLLSPGDRSHFLNDLVVTGDGTVYATDSDGVAIYRIDAEGDTLELFAARAGMPWPNGITWSEDASVLFVALDGRIGRIDPDEGQIHCVELPEGVRAFADGLYFVDQSLVAVWPGAEGHGVTRYHRNAALDRVVEVESLLPTHPATATATTSALTYDGWGRSARRSSAEPKRLVITPRPNKRSQRSESLPDPPRTGSAAGGMLPPW